MNKYHITKIDGKLAIIIIERDVIYLETLGL